jgi:hypothetical protein
MTIIKSLNTGNTFTVAGDTTGNLEFQVGNSVVGMVLSQNNEISFGDSALQIATGNVSVEEIGVVRYNTANSKYEVYNGTTWISFS